MKLTGGFYYVVGADGELHESKACGRFRKENIKPLVGDLVEFEKQNGLAYGFIEEIVPRANELVRPAVANIDMVVLVVSASQPHIDFILCDKLLIQAERAGIESALCINKTETNAKSAEAIKRQYAEYLVLCVSAVEKTGINDFREIIRGKCVCMTGQSAVGKSTLLNVLDDGLELETGGLSKKTARGKHTTRTVELLPIKKLDAYVFDTPGFSMFDIGNIAKEELQAYYPEFHRYAGKCKFSTCVHDSEPGCAVKQAVESRQIDENRYKRYLKIKESLRENYD